MFDALMVRKTPIWLSIWEESPITRTDATHTLVSTSRLLFVDRHCSRSFEISSLKGMTSFLGDGDHGAEIER
jgi:hypothetical protein